VYGEEGRLLGIDVSALKTVVKYVLNASAFVLASHTCPILPHGYGSYEL
jgi:hypothetical protein